MSKKNKEEKPKKNRGKVVKKVLAIILIVIIAFAAVTTCITAVGLAANGKKVKSFPAVGCDLKYENMGGGLWNIYSDNRVYHLTNTSINKSRMLWIGVRYNFNSYKASNAPKPAETDRNKVRLGL